MKSILITQSQLRNYSGSEMVTLEIAEHFVNKLKWRVSVLTHHYSDPIKQEFEKLNIEVILSSSEDAKTINLEAYDILWVQHYTLVPSLIEGMRQKKRRTKVVFNHMSFVEALEAVHLPSLEGALADVILFNSQETKDNLVRMSGLSQERKFRVFDNPAPESFLGKTKTQSTLHNVAVISNHPPEELVDAVEIIKSKGVKVDYIGRFKGGLVERVTPGLLDKYDVIVTIGKTIQYSIIRGKSVYCYDRFGGPGYLNEGNYDLAHYHNFSGRGFKTKSPEEIAHEIIDGYTKSIVDIFDIKNIHGQDFIIGRKIEEVLSLGYEEKQQLSETEVYPLIKYSEVMLNIMPRFVLYSHYVRHIPDQDLMNLGETQLKINDANTRNRELEEVNKILTGQLKETKASYDSILRSKSFRLVKSIVKPIRMVKRIVKSISISNTK